MFYIDGKFMPAVAGLVYIKSKIKRGETIYINGELMLIMIGERIKRFIANEGELEELINEIKEA